VNSNSQVRFLEPRIQTFVHSVETAGGAPLYALPPGPDDANSDCACFGLPRKGRLFDHYGEGVPYGDFSRSSIRAAHARGQCSSARLPGAGILREPPDALVRGYGDALAEIPGELSTDLQVLAKQFVRITVRDSPRRHPA